MTEPTGPNIALQAGLERAEDHGRLDTKLRSWCWAPLPCSTRIVLRSE